MDDYIKNQIKEEAMEIRRKLNGTNGNICTLFGEKIDMEDQDMVLVASYQMGKNEELIKKLDDLRFLRSLKEIRI